MSSLNQTLKELAEKVLKKETEKTSTCLLIFQVLNTQKTREPPNPPETVRFPLDHVASEGTGTSTPTVTHSFKWKRWSAQNGHYKPN